MRFAILQVDDSHDAPAAQYGYRKKCFKLIFRQVLEQLKSRILGCIQRHGYRLAMLRYPSRNSLPESQPQPVDNIGVRVFGSAENQLALFQSIKKAGIAINYRRG